jgi:hypothetical protein
MSDLFKEVEKVLKDREFYYGDAGESFHKVAELWSSILGVELEAPDVMMCMIALKLCREINNPKKDNVIDMIGYLKLYSDEVDHDSFEATPPPVGKKV